MATIANDPRQYDDEVAGLLRDRVRRLLGLAGQRSLEACPRVGEVRPRLVVEALALARGRGVQRSLEAVVERAVDACVQAAGVRRDVRGQRRSVADVPGLVLERAEHGASDVVERTSGHRVVLGEDEQSVHDGAFFLCVLHGPALLTRGFNYLQ